MSARIIIIVKVSFASLLLAIILAVFNLNGCTHVTDAAKGKMVQLEEEFKKGTVLSRAKGRLADARDVRKYLIKTIDGFHVDAETALREAKRREEEKGNILESFKKLQDAAKKAGLPKYTDATAEDKTKTLPIGTKMFTGEETYNKLKDYKIQIERVDRDLERKRKQADFFKKQAEGLRTQKLAQTDDNIIEMENTIADYEMYQELLTANKTVEALGLSDDKMDKLLDTDDIMEELKQKIDVAGAEVETPRYQENPGDMLDRELDYSSLPSITDDDLI